MDLDLKGEVRTGVVDLGVVSILAYIVIKHLAYRGAGIKTNTIEVLIIKNCNYV